MDLRSLLERYANIARREILQDHSRESCVPSTWVTVEVFRRLGVAAEPFPVKVSVGNGAYGRRVSQVGPPRSYEELVRWGEEDGSFVVGVGTQPTQGGIGGHLVALVGGQYLVDASLDQATSEEHGLRVPGVLVIQLRPGELSNGFIRRGDSDLWVEYVMSPTAEDYTALADWGRTPEVRAAVERILATLAATT
jgi:hypothetical protein